MSFVATAPANPLPLLPHHPFWPAIDPNACRELMQLDGTVKNARLVFALMEAVGAVNRDLSMWRRQQQDAGHATLEDVPDEEPDRLPYLYRRAVVERAAADLMEHYRRFDATGDGQSRAEEQQPTIDDHRRNSFWAVRDIQGQCRAPMELL
jgi:hypothetical protein